MSLDKPNALLAPADVAVATDVAGLVRLKSAARERSPEALEAVARQFESLFLEMMLKSMRDASLGDGIFDSDAGELYQGMFDKQVSLDMARGKGLGIAEMLIRQLSPPATTAPQPLDGIGGTSPLLRLERERGLLTPGGASTESVDPSRESAPARGLQPPRAQDWNRSPADFVRQVLPHAREAAKQLGVHPLSLVAQAALETGWGKRVIAHADGASSFNLFGIKAGEEWQGTTAGAHTLEFEAGVAGGGSVIPVRRSATFRSYSSIADSFADYVKLLSSSPRYREVLQSGTDTARFAESIGRSGYATDPAYADKIKGLLGGDTLRGALAALKNSTSQPI